MPPFANVAQASEFADLLEIGLTDVFEDSLPTHPKLYTGWLTVKKAKEWIEDELVVTGFGAMPAKDIGGVITTDKPYISSPKDFTLKPFALGFVAEYELTRWDKYGIFGDMTRELTRSAVDRCNILAYSLLNNGFATSDPTYTIYNGEALFSNAHALLGGGTTKNRPDSDVALSYLALQQARIDLSLLKNERGLYVRTSPSNLIVHPSKEWQAETLLQSTRRPGTADNDKNTLPSWSIHASPYLTSEEAFFVTAAKDQLRIKFKTGDDPMFRKDFDASTWNSVFSVYQSIGIAVLHYQGTWGSTGGA
jgi:hypothetical protein